MKLTLAAVSYDRGSLTRGPVLARITDEDSNNSLRHIYPNATGRERISVSNLVIERVYFVYDSEGDEWSSYNAPTKAREDAHRDFNKRFVPCPDWLYGFHQNNAISPDGLLYPLPDNRSLTRTLMQLAELYYGEIRVEPSRELLDRGWVLMYGAIIDHSKISLTPGQMRTMKILSRTSEHSEAVKSFLLPY